MANQGMLTIDEVLEQSKWITDPTDPNGGLIEFIQEPQVSIEQFPKSMTPPEIEQSVWSEAEILRLEEAAKVAEAWKTEFQRMMKANADLQRENKKIAELEQGMLTATLKAEAETKVKKVEVKAKEAEAKRIAEEEAKISQDVAKDLAEEDVKISKKVEVKAKKAEVKAKEDVKISKDVAKDLDEDSGRKKPVKMENLRGEKPGFVMAEGNNWWSVDEKDLYWQTKEGYKEAMNLYGQKPAWVKESSLEYNPKTGKYDPIKKEEFDEIKPKKRISL